MAIADQIKGLARHSSIYTLSTFIQRALGFVMLPIYTDIKYLPSQSTYGDLSLVYTFMAFMNIVYLYGMDSALLRYFFIGEHKREDVYKTAFITVVLNSFILSTILFLFAPEGGKLIFGAAGYKEYIWLASVILFFDGLGNLPYLILRAEEKSVTYSVMRIGRFLLEFALNIVFVVILRMEVIGILYANAIASLINFLALLPYQKKYLKGSFEFKLLKILSMFALPMLPNGLAYLIVEVSDRYLMLFLLGKDTVGIYSPSYKFGSILLFIVIAFRTAWQPFFLKVAKETNAKEIYAKVMTYFTLGGVLVIIGASYLLEYVLKMPLAFGKPIIGEKYWGGLIIMPIIMSSYLFYGMYVNLTVGIYIKKKTQYMIIFSGLAALANVGSNFYLMPHYGIVGAAIATLLSYLIMAVTIFVANQKIYHVPYEYGRLIFLLVLLTGSMVVYYAFDISIVVRIAVLIIIPVIFYLTGFFKTDEINALRRLLAKSKAG